MSTVKKAFALVTQLRNGEMTIAEVDVMNDCCDGLSKAECDALAIALSVINGDAAMELVENVKKGEFVRRGANAKTYQRGDYDRSSNSYSLVDCDDVCREVFVKKGTPLIVGFTY